MGGVWSALPAELGRQAFASRLPWLGRSKGEGHRSATEPAALGHWPAKVILLLLLRFWGGWLGFMPGVAPLGPVEPTDTEQGWGRSSCTAVVRGAKDTIFFPGSPKFCLF